MGLYLIGCSSFQLRINPDDLSPRVVVTFLPLIKILISPARTFLEAMLVQPAKYS